MTDREPSSARRMSERTGSALVANSRSLPAASLEAARGPGAAQGVMQGENIIYVGGSASFQGCFELSLADFQAKALFWGHGGRTQTLEEWVNTVSSWSQGKGFYIKPYRNRLLLN